jgi:hypothetical protein
MSGGNKHYRAIHRRIIKKQILAQQPFLVRAFPFGISRQICFFYEVGLSDQCPQPLLHEEKTLTYPGFEPGTFGFQAGLSTAKKSTARMILR